MIAAVVPVKSLAAAKSRLLPDLGREGVKRLSIAMLQDVLAALLGASSVDRVAVVTSDDAVAAVAKEAGVEVVLTKTVGLNPSIEEAAEQLSTGSDDVSLVVLGDVAGARPDELERLVGAAPARGIALAPSSDGGTSALVRTPRDVIAAGFGPDSASVHRRLAADAGVACVELELPSLAVDIDRREDLEAFARQDGSGKRTRALLRELQENGAP